MASEKRTKRVEKVLQRETALPSYRARRWTLLFLLGLAGSLLVWHAVNQQILETNFLQQEGKRRHLRVVEMPAYRGMIVDRRGEPLAVSTPVDSVWANPRVLHPDHQDLVPLAKILGKNPDEIRRQLAKDSRRAFVYVKRRINPDIGERLREFLRERKLEGVGLLREYRRYYPSGEVFAHVAGLTNIDDQGLAGLELVYDDWLKGVPGKKRVIRDGRAQVVENVESIQTPKPGRTLHLSLDRRLQFLAYRELKAAVQRHKAISASAVILDVRTGEVLAMVNQPAYNPNGSKDEPKTNFRNRAVTDLFEPGSTMKPFTVASALELGRIQPDTLIDTTSGRLKVGSDWVTDSHGYKIIDVATVISKSSNVGISKIALDLPREQLWKDFSLLGFGEASGIAFPGEATGQLAPYQQWAPIDHASIAFGYGISVNSLQLAQAYAVLAADGVRRPVSLLQLDRAPDGERVMSVKTSRQVRAMLESVVSDEGTAPAAAIFGYRVAGKTGTVKKSVSGGYADDRYQAIFAGMAPASNPRMVMVVVVDEPRNGKFYGGQVAAPVFSRVMAGALRLLNISPDAMDGVVELAGTGGAG